MELVFTRGLPGSGKSTYAQELSAKSPNKYKLVTKDDLRRMIDGGKWSKANEKFIEDVEAQIVDMALADKKSVIVHNTGFAPKHAQRYRELAKKHGAQFRIKDFTDVPLEVCIERDLKRLHSVGEKVIRDMHQRYLTPTPQAPPYVEGLPDAIIVDLDGTLADLCGRNPYDASTCENDGPHEVIIGLAWDFLNGDRTVRDIDYQEFRRKVVLMSGREDKFRPETERWLNKHGVIYDALYMRATDDQRKDAIVKRELYEQHVLGKYNIRYVLDDRDQVVYMWRHELGLRVLQVAEGDF